MIKRHPLSALGLAVLLLLGAIGCSTDDNPSNLGNNLPHDDTTVPGPVTDLRFARLEGYLVTLIWTAPGDDGDAGRASEYDVRFARSGITSTNWASSYLCQNEPSPAVAGTEQTVTVNVGSEGEWHFALKTADEVPNWSTLSNNLKVTIGDTGPAYDIH